MRKPQGYGILVDPDARGPEEHDTFTCKHCSRVVIVKPRCDPADMGGVCYGCSGLICKRCVATGRCDPIEEKLRRAEARADTLRSYGLA